MVKREKRLRKGAASLERQKEIHEKKLEEAIKLGDEDLKRYYIKEINKFEKEREYKLSKLHRKDKDFKEENIEDNDKEDKKI